MKNTNGFKFTKKSLMIIGAIGVVIIAVLIAILLIVNGSKDPAPAPEHEHSWGEWKIVTEPTCILDGTQEKTCACGEKETRSIGALGHTEVIDAAKAPTCTEAGLTEGKHCSICNEVLFAQQTVPATGHTYDNEQDSSCNVCGYIRNVECVHTNTTTLSAINATCTQNGLTEGKKCADCCEVLVAQMTVHALGHTEVIDAAKAPTCTVNGLTEGKHCSVCNTVLVAQRIVSATGHTEVIDAAKAPTCTINGLTEGKHCSVCNYIIDAQVTIPAPGAHSYSYTIEDHNVSDDIVVIYTCTRCGDTYSTTEELTDFTVTADNRSMIGYTGADGENLIIPAIFEDNGTWYTVRCIGENAFGGTKIKSLVIPYSVETIENRAFKMCYYLTDVTIGDGVTIIGQQAFYDCRVLKNVILGDGLITLDGWAFYYCYLLENITIPKNVKNISNSAFGGCFANIDISVDEENQYFKSIDGNLYSKDETTFVKYAIGKQASDFVIPDGVTSIFGGAFHKCEYIVSIVIPNTVTEIGDWGFDQCVSLEKISFNGTVAQWDAILKGNYWDSAIRNYTIYCTNGNISKDGTITYYYSRDLFYTPNDDGTCSISGAGNCTDLDIVIPEYIDGYKVTSIGNYAFSNRSNITSIVIPESVTSIGDYAFHWCSGLTEVVIPNSVTSIGDYAFYWCANLTSIVIPDSVTSIGDFAFENCCSITSIVVPNKLTKIGCCTFSSCKSLTTIVINHTVEAIMSWGLSNCSNLTSIIFTGTIEQWSSISKASTWNSNTGSYTVYCTDGNITK